MQLNESITPSNTEENNPWLQWNPEQQERARKQVQQLFDLLIQIDQGQKRNENNRDTNTTN